MDSRIIQDALDKNDGSPIKAARFLNVPVAKIYYNISKYNLKHAKRIKTNLLDDQIKEAYLKNPKPTEIAKQFNVKVKKVKYLIKKANFKKTKQRYEFDKTFFDKDTEESFYWAGFGAADGCLCKKGGSFEFKFGLARKDISQLEKFKKHIKATHPIHTGITKAVNSKHKDTQACSIVLLNPDFERQLSRFNITLRKTHIYKFPEWMINHPLVNHFMRGYFDGDGSIYKLRMRGGRTIQNYGFNVLGTREFLEVYKHILETQAGIDFKENRIRQRNGTCSLDYGGNGILFKIKEFLYKDHTFCLERKRDLFDDVKLTMNPLKIEPNEMLNLIEEHGSFEDVGKILNKSKSTIRSFVYKSKIHPYVKEKISNFYIKNPEKEPLVLDKPKKQLIELPEKLNISEVKREIKEISLYSLERNKFEKYNNLYFTMFIEEKGGKLLSKYENVRTKIEIDCGNGHIFKIQPRHLVEGQWCKECFFDKIRKNGCEDNILSRNDEESFYLAGLFVSRGRISKINGGYNTYLSLPKEDNDYLEFIKQKINYKNKTSLIKENTYAITITSKNLFEDLIKFGMVDGNNGNYIIPNWVLDNENFRHFLRGYFDGKGNFTICKNKNQKSHITFSLGGSKEFIRQVNEKLYLDEIFKDIGSNEKKIQRSGSFVINKIQNYLYKDCSIYLKRRKNES
jgi:DNA-binding transcriptional regulator WhiA